MIGISSVTLSIDGLVKLLVQRNDPQEREIRGTRGEHTESEGGIYDISNKRRLGLTEREVVFEMRNGVLELIKQEKQLQEDQP